MSKWITCQIGAREHYSIPRALQMRGELESVFTDFWVSPRSCCGALPKMKRLKDRYHEDLSKAQVIDFNATMLFRELRNKWRNTAHWNSILERNACFQQLVVDQLEKRYANAHGDYVVFSYSYAAKEIFTYAKSRGWQTVLGQIDPGPEEERIVLQEHQKFPNIESSWSPAPEVYWKTWREEVALADKIIVNSSWSQECLLKAGIVVSKMSVVPLVYTSHQKSRRANATKTFSKQNPLRVLFLGQINLRKGIARLLEAMRLLEGQPIELVLIGPTEVSPKSWEMYSNVTWKGAIPRSQVHQAYANADVFILPTVSDGYAITQLEALSNGLPVIASKYCGEVVVDGKNGYVLNDLNSETIVTVLERCLVQKWSKDALEVKEMFNMNSLGDALIAAV